MNKQTAIVLLSVTVAVRNNVSKKERLWCPKWRRWRIGERNNRRDECSCVREKSATAPTCSTATNCDVVQRTNRVWSKLTGGQLNPYS